MTKQRRDEIWLAILLIALVLFAGLVDGNDSKTQHYRQEVLHGTP